MQFKFPASSTTYMVFSGVLTWNERDDLIKLVLAAVGSRKQERELVLAAVGSTLSSDYSLNVLPWFHTSRNQDKLAYVVYCHLQIN